MTYSIHFGLLAFTKQQQQQPQLNNTIQTKKTTKSHARECPGPEHNVAISPCADFTRLSRRSVVIQLAREAFCENVFIIRSQNSTVQCRVHTYGDYHGASASASIIIIIVDVFNSLCVCRLGPDKCML